MNNCACRERANCTRSASGTKVSSVRVITTRYLPGFLELVAQRDREIEHDVLFLISPPPALVPVSMPPWPGSITISGRGSPEGLAAGSGTLLFVAARMAVRSSASLRMKVSRSVADRSSTSRAGWPSLASSTTPSRSAPVWSRRSRCASRPAITRPKRNALTSPRPVSPGRGKLEHGLRHIDHHAIGIGERESPDAKRPGHIHDQSGFLVVPGNAHVGCDRKRRGHAGATLRGRGRKARKRHNNRRNRRNPKAAGHKPSPARSLLLRKSRVNGLLRAGHRTQAGVAAGRRPTVNGGRNEDFAPPSKVLNLIRAAGDKRAGCDGHIGNTGD